MNACIVLQGCNEMENLEYFFHAFTFYAQQKSQQGENNFDNLRRVIKAGGRLTIEILLETGIQVVQAQLLASTILYA